MKTVEDLCKLIIIKKTRQRWQKLTLGIGHNPYGLRKGFTKILTYDMF